MVQTANIFDAFSKLNVLIVGDVMIDRYLSGKVSRISPEAPVPVVHLQERDNRLGGAANVALNIRAMGATPYLCSVIGDDQNADLFMELLPTRGLPTKGIVRSTERMTTVKTRIIASSQHLLRVDQEVTTPLSENEQQQYLSKIWEILGSKDIHVILFQDYNKGVLTPRVINEIMLEAIKHDIPTAVDPKFENFWAYKHVTLFKPNLKEIRAQVPFKVDVTQASLQQAAAYIREQLGNQHTIITLSEHGLFSDARGDSRIIPTFPRSIADVCGAGDTVISMVALGLALKMDIHEIGRLSNLAGGQVCEKVGVVPVNKEQLQHEYEAVLQNS